MSKGSTVKPVRFDDELLAQINAAITAINHTRHDEPHDFSSFIRYCVRHKLAHLARGRRKSKAR